MNEWMEEFRYYTFLNVFVVFALALVLRFIDEREDWFTS